MSIRIRLRLGIVLLILIFVVLGVWIYLTAQHIDQLVNQSVLVGQIVDGNFNLNSATVDFMAKPGLRASQQWNARHSQLFILINSMDTSLPRTTAAISNIRQLHQTLGNLFNLLLDNENAYVKGEIPPETYDITRQQLYRQIVIKLQSIATEVGNLSKQYADQLLAAQRQIVVLSLVSIGTLIILLVLGMIYIDFMVIHPITSLTETARAISEGNLNARVVEKRQDEIGILAHTFNQMTAELKNTLQGLETELRERERVSLELQQSEEKSRALFQAIPDAKFILDWDATFLEFLPGNTFNPLVPPETFIGKKAEEVLPMSLATQLHFYLAKAIQTHLPQVYEYPLPDEKGTMRYFEARLVTSGNNRALAIIREVTERVQNLAKIEQMNIELERRVNLRTAELQATVNELESFSYTISHDLRAPLRAMVGYTRLVMTEHADTLSTESMAHLDRVYQNALRMGRMVDELLSFARLGRQTIQRSRLSETSLRRIIDVILAELREEYKNRYVDVLIGKLPSCDADPTLLQQVLVNLLSNAFKFTLNREQAKIEIGFTDTPNGPIYFVRDNGAGFDMQYASKLFGVFERLHSPGEFEGTGVGLAIVHRIITKHGGRVWAESEPDKGACFYFTLPSVSRNNKQ